MINEFKEETQKLVYDLKENMNKQLKELREFKQMNEINKTMQNMKEEFNKDIEIPMKRGQSKMNR
jgi:hypothetical protein